MATISLPWFFIGDFNYVLGAHEKTGLAPYSISCLEFCQAIDAANLIEVNTRGAFFTWARMGAMSFVESKLDKSSLLEVLFGFLELY